MTMYNRKDNESIVVSSKNGKLILNKHGFAVITKGNHKGFKTIDEEALWNMYSTEPKDDIK